MHEQGRVLFVTGRLAEPSLRRVLAEAAPPFPWDVAAMKITVAALMTTDWIGRFLRVPEGISRVLIPGLCEGDTAPLSDRFGVPVEKGPKDLRELPSQWGRSARAESYGAWDIEIVAEINNAPRLAPNVVSQRAEYFRAAGADVIDIGCTPGLLFPGLGPLIRDLVSDGHRVSIDTFDQAEIRTAVDAGARMVLSLNRSNIDVAPSLAGSGARVVAVPDLGDTLDTLEPTLSALERYGVPYLIDPILEPIGHGFMASLGRFAEVRRRYPDAEMLMGIGNLTELTAADSTGVNALLMAICQELGVRAVLTTEVTPWARGAVRELDVARRLMHYAVTERTIPKGVDDRLLTTRDPSPLTVPEDELRALHASITDPNFRIFADAGGITVLNNDLFIHGTNVQDIFDQLGVTDASHAFYLGTELARAHLAMQLGKTYRQDGQLSWGYLTPPEEPRRHKI
jgi:dihydropteroate synthase-like protein